MFKFKQTATVALLVTGIGFAGVSNATSYTWAQLPTLAGYKYSDATKLNDLGQVVGFSRSATMPNGDVVTHATLWSNGSVTDLGTLGGAGTKSMAYGINNAGQIVGASNISTDTVWHATLWDKGSVTNLGSVTGYDSGLALSINNGGQIVGDSLMSVSTIPNVYNIRATLWSDGIVIDLGTLGGTESQPLSINDNGQIVGDSSITVNGAKQAVIWNANSINKPEAIGISGTIATDINNSGQVVGITGYPNPPSYATLWSNGSTTDFGTLGGPWNSASSINDAGQVVGSSGASATLWSSNTGLLDLNNLLATPLPGGTHLNGTFDINNVGQILAQANNGYYVLTPTTVPVPGAVWLFGSGLGLLTFTRRKKQNS